MAKKKGIDAVYIVFGFIGISVITSIGEFLSRVGVIPIFVTLLLIIGISCVCLYCYNRARAAKISEIESEISALVDKHLSALTRKRISLIRVDEYGQTDYTKWDAELKYFMEKIVKPHFRKEDVPYISENITSLANRLVSPPVRVNCDRVLAEISFHDTMDPLEYERYCSSLFSRGGWITRLTPAGGDQGADVIAEKNDRRVVIQCKLYSSPVGNKAVQEIIAAKLHYRAQNAVVITNNSYTRSAKDLAASAKVHLLHHSDIFNIDIMFLNS